MPFLNNDAAVWACVLAGLACLMLILGQFLRKNGSRGLRLATALLLPGVCGLALARGGYELLQHAESLSRFRWCYTAGLSGLVLGTWLAARLVRLPALKVLDAASGGICCAMAFARFSQRWLGDVGTGPCLDEGTLLCRPPFVLLNDWGEPLLAIFLAETLCCLIAMGAAFLSERHSAGIPGVTTARALTLLLIPQILLEQFRTGQYMRWRMVRLEQVLCALAALAVLVLLCRACKGKNAARRYAPVPVFLLLAGIVIAVQFVLDGKLMELPHAVCWTAYGLAIAGLIVTEDFAAHRLAAASAERN